MQLCNQVKALTNRQPLFAVRHHGDVAPEEQRRWRSIPVAFRRASLKHEARCS